MKSALAVFPYHADSSGIKYPVIPITLQYKGRKKDFLALIDSGASTCVFRKEVAESLNIMIEKGKLTYLGGVGGHIKGYIHEIQVEVAGKQFLSPIVFSHEYFVSFNLLGRDSFFKNFTITFQESSHQVKLD